MSAIWQAEINKRRSFAIISHPDAGKTTLTEKLLLYAGAIHLAGSVKARKASRHAVSDWMKMEQERGISVTSSVLQFEYQNCIFNLLDTPGHADFSEDTYRTLAAVDAAVMLIDSGKGVEARTYKLFEVCRRRQLPIVTFINKLDRDGLPPLALLDDIAHKLSLKVVPINWPVGMGRDFQGIVDVGSDKSVTLFSTLTHGTGKSMARQCRLEDLKLSPGERDKLQEELLLVEIANDPFCAQQFLQGSLSPAFFGSAMQNFGIEALLAFLCRHAPAPTPRRLQDGTLVMPDDPEFSGFVFKIQANMNPKHRDRIAFLRVVSGRFERDMQVVLGRTRKTIRLSKPHSFLAQERTLVEQAYPGDIVGLYDSGTLRIGDTVASHRSLQFTGIPCFAPEYFATVHLNNPLKRKGLDAGITQLSLEGVVQPFYALSGGPQQTMLGAVGLLQFEVLKERLHNEYQVETRLQMLPFKVARWLGKEVHEQTLQWFQARRDYPLLRDRHGHWVVLFESEWAMMYAEKNAPYITLCDVEPL